MNINVVCLINNLSFGAIQSSSMLTCEHEVSTVNPIHRHMQVGIAKTVEEVISSCVPIVLGARACGLWLLVICAWEVVGCGLGVT
jgi:hypothetical protein